MKNMPGKMTMLFVLAICAVLISPAAASAVVEEEVLLNGENLYEPGKYTLDLDLVGDGKTKYVELKVVNGDGTRHTMVSSVKITMGSGDEKIVVISPEEFKKKNLSNVFGILGKDVLGDMTAITLEMKVGGSKKHRKDMNDDNEDVNDGKRMGFIKRFLKKHKKPYVDKKKGIRLVVTEYYEKPVVNWPPRPSGW